MTEADAFRRIAIVNRGEPAVRLLRAVRELNVGRTEPYRTIALYTEPDAGAKFVREADETYCIGEALYVDPDGLRKSTYLDYDRLRRALTETRAEAAWVGWGLVAEHAAFADMCDELGVAFIGPSGDTMRKLGDKIASKHLAEEAGVPVAPWSKGPVGSVEEAREQAERIGYPLMVKATAGGGGRGIRKVRSADELEEAFESARREAYAGFGDDTVFLERMLAGARHIEVQIIGDGKGTTWGLGVRDCTVQRRNQKVFEEAPSPALTEAQDAEIRDAAARLGTAAGYRNAGTVEFLYDPETKTFSFMEVNARLQVEHPVTELATGADLVKLQIHVASGGSLGALTMPPHRGHAIEARITAEAPERDFAPAPGRISRLRLPAGPGVRVDAGVDEGDEVAPQFDSMIAKVITFGKDREEALGRLHRALFEMELLVEGGASNKGFLLGMLEREEMRTSDIHIGWLDALAAKREHVTSRGASVAVVEAAIQAYLVEEDLDQRRFFVSASRGRPEPSESLGRKLELSHEGIPYEVGVRRLDANRYSVDLEGHVIAVRREALGDAMIRIGCGDRTYQALSMSKGVERVVEIDGIPHRVASEGGGTIRASAPGVVVRLAVEVGQEVQADAPLVVLEAMKTEMTLVAPFAGKVRKVLVEPNVQVGAGAALLQLEESEDEGATPQAGERLAFEDLACAPAEPETQRHLTTLESVILGFDGDVAGLAKVLAEHGTLTPGVAPGDAAVFDRELAILEKFVDIMSLFRRAPSEDTGELEIAESEAEYLHLYLRDLSSKAEALPESFRRRLGRALAHFGIDGLEPTDALREALFRILKSRVQARVQGGRSRGSSSAGSTTTATSRCGWTSAGAASSIASWPPPRDASRPCPIWPSRRATATSSVRSSRPRGSAATRRCGR
jgi:acetyl/propionyl-CoA carboxylase alpha subunit